MGGLVNAQSFYNTFQVSTKTDSGADMIGLIVAIVSLTLRIPRSCITISC
jgi:hypothetical protein